VTPYAVLALLANIGLVSYVTWKICRRVGMHPVHRLIQRCGWGLALGTVALGVVTELAPVGAALARDYLQIGAALCCVVSALGFDIVTMRTTHDRRQ